MRVRLVTDSGLVRLLGWTGKCGLGLEAGLGLGGERLVVARAAIVVLVVDEATAARVVVRGAAADGEAPKEAGDDAKGDGTPDEGEEGGIDAGADAIRASRGLQSTNDSSDNDGAENGSAGDGRGCDAGRYVRQTRPQARAAGEEGEEELEAEQADGGNVQNLGPLYGRRKGG